MVKKGVVLNLAFVLLLFLLSSSYALEFNGTIYDEDGNALNNTLINITIRDMNGFSVVGYNWTYSNSSGWFNLTLPDNNSWMFEPEMLYYNGSFVEFIGQKLPAFPGQILSDVSGTDFFLRRAGTINITAVNRTGSPIYFNYQIKDQKLGYMVADSMGPSPEANMALEAVVYVPRNRNYSIMIFPNASMPASYDWNNFSSSSSYTFGLSSYNASTHTLNKKFNMTMGHARVSGYIKVPGVSGWDEFTVVPYLVEPGSMVHAQYGSLPYNLSDYFENGGSDHYNLSTGITNYSGFYNISLPSTVEASEMILFAVAKNNSAGYYGGFLNLSLDYASYPNGESYKVNFTKMYGLLGTASNISLETVNGGSKNVSAKLQSFNIFNSTNGSFNDVFVHVEAKVDYSSYGAKEFTWMADVSQGSVSRISIPLLNVTGIEEFNVFVGGGDYAPRSESLSVSEIESGKNITISSFSPRDINGQISNSSITVAMYKSNSTCDVPVPPSGCVLGGGPEGMDTFDPMKITMGGGKVSIRMGSGDVLVHYVNVDLLASGPPDAAFEDNSQVSETKTGSFGKAMKFGSSGPKIYDYVLVSIPYTEGSSSVAGLNESGNVSMNISKLYDEDWNEVWDTALNGTNGTFLGGNLSHYRERASEWETLLEGVSCLKTTTGFNSTNPCYVDTTNNRIWIRIPHFSGAQPSISGDVTSTTSNNNNNGDSGNDGGSSGTSNNNNLATYSPDKAALAKGYDVSIGEGAKVKMTLAGESHTLEVLNISGSKVNVKISSEPIELELSKGETKKVDVNNDSFYDLSVYLKDLSAVRARFVLKSINESYEMGVKEKQESSSKEGGEEENGGSKLGGESGGGLGAVAWISIVLVILAVVGWAYYFFRVKRRGELRAVEKGSTKGRAKN